MPDQMAAYLFVADGDDAQAQPDNVFFRAASVSSAVLLCKIFASAFPGQKQRIRSGTAAAIPLERQILLDEVLAQLEMYDDPDPGIYDPEPTRDMLQRAEWARRARGWEAQIPKEPGPNTPPAPPTDAPKPMGALDARLEKLLLALEWHRLLFLFSADACRRNPLSGSGPTGSNERVDRDKIRGWNEMMADADEDGRFILEHREVIDCYAEAAIQAFGPGEGVRPTALDAGDRQIPVDGASFPYWSLREWTSRHLEDSSDGILDACKALALADHESRFRDVVRSSIQTARAENHTKWTPSIIVRWSYLARLDAQIRRIKEARVETAMPSAAEHKQAAASSSAKPDSQQIADLVVLCTVTRDLLRTQHDYPDAVPASDYQALLRDLIATSHRLLASPGFEKFQEMMNAPVMAESEPSDRFAMMMTAAMMSHPILEKAPESPAEIRRVLEEAMNLCQTSISPHVSHMASRFANMMVLACRTPTAPDVKEFKDPARFRQLLSHYWNVARELVQTQTHAHVGFSPHPLLPLIENLRDRIRTSFSHLTAIQEAADIGKSCDALLAVLTEGEAGDLSVAPEWADGEVQKVDRFIAQAGLRLGARVFPLTAAEEYFIKLVAGLADEHKKRVNDAWRRLLADADAKGPAATEQAKRDEAANQAVPTPAVVPAVVLGRPGDPCTVNGVQTPPLTDAQYAVIAALIAAADDGLTKDALEAIRPSARRILAELQQKKGWADVIQMAGTTNGRYRLRR